MHGHVFEHPYVSGMSVRAEIEELCGFTPTDMPARDDLAPLLVTRVLPTLTG